jgi:hypothetical protein
MDVLVDVCEAVTRPCRRVGAVLLRHGDAERHTRKQKSGTEIW